MNPQGSASAEEPREAPTSWRFASADPPDEDTCRELAAFVLRVQDEPEWYPKEKDRILSWKLRENECHAGFASMMVTPDGSPVSLCTVTPKRFWVRGEEQRWAEVGDTFTDTAYQRLGMFSAVTDATRARALVRTVLRLPRSRGTTVHEERLFGADYDALWQSVRAELPCAQVRDARYLRWRHRANPMPFRLRAALDLGVDLVVAHDARRSPLPLPWPRGPLIQRNVDKPVIIHQSDAGKRVVADLAPWHPAQSDSDAF